MAWARASIPVAAVSFLSMVTVVSGSMSDASGTIALLMMAIFTILLVSRMIANWETSAPVPAVVGMHIIGTDGVGIISTPSKSSTCILFDTAAPMAFAQSMGLPPPRATIMLHSSASKTAAPSMTSWSRGLGVTSSKMTYSRPSSSRDEPTSSTRPVPFINPLSVTRRTLSAPRFRAYLPAKNLAPSPNTNSLVTNFLSSPNFTTTDQN